MIRIGRVTIKRYVGMPIIRIQHVVENGIIVLARFKHTISYCDGWPSELSFRETYVRVGDGFA